MTNFDKEREHSEERNEGMPQNETHISLDQNENKDDLHTGLILGEHEKGNTCNIDVNAVSEVAESVDHVTNHAWTSIKWHERSEQDEEHNKKRIKVLDQKEIEESKILQGTQAEASSRKKLLVLDVNGLLVDIHSDLPDGYEADLIIGRKAVFKRPFCDDFLQFCFDKFNVGVWSSRTKRNVESVLDFIMGETMQNLVFCWDQSHCTETSFKTVENRDKPLLLKELKKLWEKHEPNLPWEEGEYNETNTLLLDDSPYKALCNPPNTAIFPCTYSSSNKNDTSLGPGGDLRLYLEGLSLAENIQKYVEENPYGQRPITETNSFWSFYCKVIEENKLKRKSNVEDTISSFTESVALSSTVQVINMENLHHSIMGKAPPVFPRKKLLILDLNAILVDIVPQARGGTKADAVIEGKYVFKRPFCDDFLKFCFEKFNVGVWSTARREQVQLTLDFLMPKHKHNFLFSWDFSHCTQTGFTTVQNRDRSLMLKELRKLWDKNDPFLPWQIGEYNESNTLLVDVSPHKALRNPQHTAIFPYPYQYTHITDNSLGPDGDLRVYLAGLASAENVQEYVEKHPFGKRPITNKNLSWQYYLKVIGYDPYNVPNSSSSGSFWR